MTDQHGAGGHGPVEYERRDIDSISITKAGLIVVGASTLTALLLIGYIGALMRQEARRAPEPRALAFDAGRQPPLPRLQEAPFQDIRALRHDEDSVLKGYGWVDRPAGVARIPVDEAMALFVKRAAAGQLTVGPAPAAPASAAGKQEDAVGGAPR